MLVADVNVFVYAHRRESPRHLDHKRWLEAALAADEPFGVSELALSGFLRIVTNHRIYREPTAPVDAMAFCDAVLDAPGAQPLRPGPRHWPIFRSLALDAGARANTIPDAYHAALAVENGATWVTHDAGFARFPGLRWRRPLDL